MNQNDVDQLVALHQPQLADYNTMKGRLKTIAYYADEKFATTPLYPNYLIGDHGTIYDMVTKMKAKGVIDKDGYRVHKFRTADGGHKNVGIHRAVMQAHNPIPDDSKMQVNHMNGIKTDNIFMPGNSHNNLEWATPSENNQHAIRTGLRISPIGENAAASKYSEAQAIAVCEGLSKGMPGPVIAAQLLHLPYNESVRGFIKAIKSRQSWPHITKNYTWEPPKKQRHNSIDNIHHICQLICEGYVDADVSRIMKERYDHDVLPQYVGAIRRAEQWPEIGRQYGFPRAGNAFPYRNDLRYPPKGERFISTEGPKSL